MKSIEGIMWCAAHHGVINEDDDGQCDMRGQCDECGDTRTWWSTTEDTPDELVDIGPCPECACDPREVFYAEGGQKIGNNPFLDVGSAEYQLWSHMASRQFMPELSDEQRRTICEYMATIA